MPLTGYLDHVATAYKSTLVTRERVTLINVIMPRVEPGHHLSLLVHSLPRLLLLFTFPFSQHELSVGLHYLLCDRYWNMRAQCGTLD